MNNTYFSLEKLLDYQGNRYELARACMEYARKVRYLIPSEYHRMGEKEALVSLHYLLEGGIKYTSDRFEIEIYEDEAEVIASQQEAERLKKLEKDNETPEDDEKSSAGAEMGTEGEETATSDASADDDEENSAPSSQEEKQDNPQL